MTPGPRISLLRHDSAANRHGQTALPDMKEKHSRQRCFPSWAAVVQVGQRFVQVGQFVFQVGRVFATSGKVFDMSGRVPGRSSVYTFAIYSHCGHHSISVACSPTRGF